ncbi:MAG: transcription antitermination factor NusB [Candidatus Pacebacteria bacterium]|nr:transcription antitermination factor NusB [Candidatus Paceibacterota bacterium]
MANRHLSRSIVLQTLFEWDFKGFPNEATTLMLERNEGEFAPGNEDLEFMKKILEYVVNKREIIDQIIAKAAPEWPIEKINAVDRNILRMGLGELLFGDHNEVPPKVAINEAIELAKTFGGDSSSRFVNGVLGAVYKEIGEPGKEQTSKRQKKMEDVDINSLPLEHKAGALVYAWKGDELYFALVHDIFGYWTLSKGSTEDGESVEAAAVREIKEETNLDIVIKDKIGESEYIASHPQQGKIRKHVTFFLAESPFVPVTLENDSGGLDDVRWFSVAEVANLKMYDDVTGYMANAISKLTGTGGGTDPQN